MRRAKYSLVPYFSLDMWKSKFTWLPSWFRACVKSKEEQTENLARSGSLCTTRAAHLCCAGRVLAGMTGTQDTLSWPWHHCHPAASPDLPAWFLPQLCHGPRVTALPSLRSLVLVPIPKCLGTARGYPGRKDTACAVVPLGCSLALLLLPLSTFVGAVSSSISSRTVGQGAWGCELCDDRCCSPKTIGPQELRCLKGIPGSSRNIAK